MKNSVRCMVSALSAAVLGTGAAFVRSVYFKSALGAEGFLMPRHPLQILFWAIAAASVLLFGVLSFRKTEALKQPSQGIFTGIAQILLGISLGLTVYAMKPDIHFRTLLRILGSVGSAALLTDGVFRCLKKNLGMIPHSLFCIFLLLYVVGMYSMWSNVPEIERILVPAVGMVLLLPLSCEMAAWDSGRGSVERILFLGSASLFFCLASLGCPDFEMLHLGGAVWAFTAVMNLRRAGEA